MCPPPTDDEFMGMADYIVESFHDLLAGDSESIFGSNSSRGSHHPSWECFMTGTPEGHVESISVDEATLVGNLGDGTKGGTAAPPHVGVEQLRAQKREIDKARQQLVWEYTEVDWEIECRRDGGRTHAVARDMN